MLFLGSGSVIHAMEEVVGHEPVLAQDMRLMGGLRKFMPVTSTTFLIGCVAISGIPPLAGFWSKDEILGQAFNSFPLLWAMGFITAGMTAFYMFRLYFLTFEGSFRGNDAALQTQLLSAAGGGSNEGEEHGHAHAEHPHESGWQMALPLAVLAVPSVLIGLLGTPWNSRFAALLEPEEAAEMAAQFSWGEFLPLAGASVAISSAGIGLAVLAYALHKIDLGKAVAGRFPAVNAFLANKWYLDAINDKLFVQGQPQAGALRAGGGLQGGGRGGEPHRPGHPGQRRGAEVLRDRPGPVLCPDRVRGRGGPGGAVRLPRLIPRPAGLGSEPTSPTDCVPPPTVGVFTWRAFLHSAQRNPCFQCLSPGSAPRSCSRSVRPC